MFNPFRRPATTPPAEAAEDVDPILLDDPVFSTNPRSKGARTRAELVLTLAANAARADGLGVATTAMDADADDCVASTIFTELDPNAAVTDAVLSWFGSQYFIGYAACAMLMQHWLVDKACAMPGRDAVRHGFVVQIEGTGDEATELEKRVATLDRKYDLIHHLQEFVRLGRGFGIRHALFTVDLGSEAQNDEYYKNPFNPDAVKPGSYRGIRQIDPYWLGPELDADAASDPISPRYFEPTWWNIGGRRIHWTHFIVYRASAVPDMLKPAYRYGGVPLTQRIMERVYAAERTANEGPLLAMAKRIITWKTDLETAMGNPEKFLGHLANMSELMNNFGKHAVDTDDDITVHDTSLAELDGVIMNQFQLVAAVAGTPATKLLGTTPKGFQSTGEHETKSYHEELETMQTNDLSPVVQRHHLMVARSDLDAAEGVRVNHTWEPVDTPTAKEYAEINKLNAETGKTLIDGGVIDGEEERNRLRSDPDSGYSDLIGEEVGGGEDDA